jgi:hypothetical protein
MNWKLYQEDLKTLTEAEYATWPWYKLPWRYFKVELCLIAIALPLVIFGFIDMGLIG